MDSNQIFNRYKEELFKQLKKHLPYKAYSVFYSHHSPSALDKVLKGDDFRMYSYKYTKITKHTLALMIASIAVLDWSSTPYEYEYDNFFGKMFNNYTMLWGSSKSIIKIKYNKEI